MGHIEYRNTKMKYPAASGRESNLEYYRAQMKDKQFHQLLDRFGFSWAGYRRVRKGVKKRLARHMQEIQCGNMEHYIEAIEKDQHVRLQFERLMTVSISRFFRDWELWGIIRERLLPLLAKNATQSIKVWSAGCASGEEVYSFKILWKDLINTYTYIPHLSILATDINPALIERGKLAVYPRSSMREVPDTIRSRYFVALRGGKYALKSDMREGIVWQAHQLLSYPPEIAFDLIFLRNNMLTYYGDQVKIPAIGKVLTSLTPGGFLIIGRHEILPSEVVDLRPWGDSTIIFQKQGEGVTS